MQLLGIGILLIASITVAAGCGDAPPQTTASAPAPAPAVPAAPAASPAAADVTPSAPAPGDTANVSSTCAAATGAHAEGAIEVVWRTDFFVSLFWAIDQASGWEDEGMSSPYAEFFAHGPASTPGDAELLKTYARLRREYSKARDTAEPEPDPATPSDMLPPRATPSQRFAHAFMCAVSTDQAAARLSMTPSDQQTLASVFTHFRPRLEAEIRRTSFLPRAEREMKALADEARMSEFLFAMGRFFGTGDAMPVPLYVDLVWGPPDSHQATAVDDHMIIPISEEIANDPKELASWVGVIVHEFGHQFLAYVPDVQRWRISNRILAVGGVLRRRHANVVDEATQAALGNLLFMRERLPAALDERFVYSYEPTLDYPDIIDTLSRRAEPLVRDALAQGEPFEGRYLEALLAAQAEVAAPRLDHFSHVALLLVGGETENKYFDGLFWGRSRFASSDVAEFVKHSAGADSISRWVVVTVEELAANREALRETMPDTGRIEHDLGKKAGCVRASQRASGAWDVTVVGRDLDGLRRTLIAIRRGLLPGDARPFCIA